jgi:hypothetical protein
MGSSSTFGIGAVRIVAGERENAPEKFQRGIAALGGRDPPDVLASHSA